MRGVVEGARRRVQEVRWTARELARTPWFSVVVVLVAGLGIGANTAIFSALSVLVLRPLPVEAPEEMVDVIAVVPGGNSFTGFSFADWRDLVDGANPLTGLAAYTAVRAPLGTDPLAPPVTVQLTSADYFSLLGVPPQLGTVRFDPAAGFGAEPSAILSHATWERAFGRDPGVVGRTVMLEGRPFTVVGVAAPGFSGHFIGFPVDAWVPLSMIEVFRPGSDPTSRADKPLELIGRRRPEATVAQIQASLTRIVADLDRRYPETNAGLRVQVTPTTGIDHSLRSGVFGILAVFGAVAALVLLIACANIGGLLLARAVTRRQEIAVRSSLGASRARLIWDAVREGLLLFVAGSLLAFGLSVWLTERLERFLAGFRLGLDLPVDLPVLAFTVTLGLLTSLVATAAPALYGTGRAPATLLGRGGGAGVGPRRARWTFVVVQVALATSLLVGAGLFTRSVRQGLRADLGLAADHVVVARVALPAERYDAQSGPVWRDAVAGQLAGVPAVSAATWAGRAPLGAAREPIAVGIPGQVPPDGQEGFAVEDMPVGPGWFDVVGLPLVAGRTLSDADHVTSAAVVVNRAFAERFWPGEEPLGRRIVLDGRSREVVGVTADARLLVQDETPMPTLYRPMEETYRASAVLVLRAAGPAADGKRALAAAVSAADAQLRVDQARTLREIANEALLPQRLASGLIGVLGLLGLVLAVLGIHGLIAYTVAQETREIGIRLALGGSRTDVGRAVLARGLRVVAIGAGAGLLTALVLAPKAVRFLVGVGPIDPLTYAGVGILVLAMGALAIALPVRRAVRVDPAVALRA